MQDPSRRGGRARLGSVSTAKSRRGSIGAGFSGHRERSVSVSVSALRREADGNSSRELPPTSPKSPRDKSPRTPRHSSLSSRFHSDTRSPRSPKNSRKMGSTLRSPGRRQSIGEHYSTTPELPASPTNLTVRMVTAPFLTREDKVDSVSKSASVSDFVHSLYTQD